MSTVMDITDDMCRAAIQAYSPDRIQGFSTPQDAARTKWGAPHYVRDVCLPWPEQEIWRGDSYEEMAERCEIERMRLALTAAFSANKGAVVPDGTIGSGENEDDAVADLRTQEDENLDEVVR